MSGLELASFLGGGPIALFATVIPVVTFAAGALVTGAFVGTPPIDALGAILVPVVDAPLTLLTLILFGAAAADAAGVIVDLRSEALVTFDGEALAAPLLTLLLLSAEARFAASGFLFSSPEVAEERPSWSEAVALFVNPVLRTAEVAAGRVGGLFRLLPRVDRVEEVGFVVAGEAEDLAVLVLVEGGGRLAAALVMVEVGRRGGMVSLEERADFFFGVPEASEAVAWWDSDSVSTMVAVLFFLRARGVEKTGVWGRKLYRRGGRGGKDW